MLNSTKALPAAREIPRRYLSHDRRHVAELTLNDFWATAKESGLIIKLNFELMSCLAEAMAEAGDEPRDYKYTWLRRRDLWQQAVSGHVAGNGIWNKEIPEPEKVEFDEKAIVRRHKVLTRCEGKWEEWFTSQGIEPLRIHYEELFDNPATVVKAVMRQFGQVYDGPIGRVKGKIWRTERTMAWAADLAKKHESH